MIPSHILNNLTPGNRIAVLSRGGEIHFLIHPTSDTPAAIDEFAEQEGSRVLVTHMSDPVAIREFVASRERDIGGQG